MNTDNNDKPADLDRMRERIAKLLNASDNSAEPEEKDAWQQKAFKLCARHGISESEARGTLREGNNVVEVLTFRLTGQYITQQYNLLVVIARALHCEPLRIPGDSRAEQHVKVYGVKIHTGRVRVLFALLNLSMLTQAARVRAPLYSGKTARSCRIDWMWGFYHRISERLTEAEAEAAADRDAETGTTTQALVLVSDAQRALATLKQQNPHTRKGRTTRRTVSSAYADGRAAGDRADLSNRSQLGNRRQIGR